MIPTPGQRLVVGDKIDAVWFRWLRSIADASDASAVSQADLDAAIATIARLLGSPDGAVETIPEQTSELDGVVIVGQGPIEVTGSLATGLVSINYREPDDDLTTAVTFPVFLDMEAHEDQQIIPGPQGVEGKQGSSGGVLLLDAEPGEDGLPGPPGLQGADGATGATGATGPAGADGAMGFLILTDGEPGEDGPMGPPGPSGSGSGGVDTANSPNANEFARFTDADTIEGLTYAETRAALDLEIGVDVQAWDATLDTFAAMALTGTANDTTLLRGDGVFSNWINTAFGIGAAPTAGRVFDISEDITGATTSYGALVQSSIKSGVTTAVDMFGSYPTTEAAAFTLAALYNYHATGATIGAGSAVTTQTGFYVDNTLTTATNNRAFRGALARASNTYNLYMDGTADNYMAGSLGIGTTSITGYSLRLFKNLTGAAASYAIQAAGEIQSDATSAHYFASSASTQATAFTLTTLRHFFASQSTIGAGSTVTTQYGFQVSSNLTGATTNYGVYSDIAAATGRWNFYASGTARNYAAGGYGFGSTTDVPSALVYMTSTTQGFRPPSMTRAQRDAISSPAAGLVVSNSSDNSLDLYEASRWVQLGQKQPGLTTTASTTSWTISADDVTHAQQTALAGALTVNAPTGTPLAGQKLVIRIKDNGTARAITWNAIFRAVGVVLPTTTVISKIVYCGFIYNATDTKWDCVAVAQEA